jgi:hypothetical protein
MKIKYTGMASLKAEIVFDSLVEKARFEKFMRTFEVEKYDR